MGRLWFLPGDGVSVIDPRHLPFNKLPPPVHIEQITADRKTSLAELVGRGSVEPAPARTESRSADRLHRSQPRRAGEGPFSRTSWKATIPTGRTSAIDRKAFYNDLPPRNYRFRVIASNNSGVWNEAGDSLDFSIDPAYYQTTWFRASCVAAFLRIALGAVPATACTRSRGRFNARLEGRVDERLRVARDLHDTLLQSFHGLLMRFQAARNLLPGRAADARQVLEAALDDAAQAITEARDAVQGMRSSTEITNELSKAVEVLGDELAEQQRAANGDAPAFSVEVEGTSRDLHPILRDEVYRMTGEALRNAFRHARARRIEVEIRYDARELRVRVRDDGIGIDASVLQEGRTGHYGSARHARAREKYRRTTGCLERAGGRYGGGVDGSRVGRLRGRGGAHSLVAQAPAPA